MTTAFRERYPGPWDVQESSESIRVVARDGTVLAYIYFEDEQSTRKALTAGSHGSRLMLSLRQSPHWETCDTLGSVNPQSHLLKRSDPLEATA